MTFKNALTTTAVILAMAAPAYAESHSGTMDETTMSETMGMHDASAFDGMTVGEILGMDVVGTNGNDVGEIDYIYEADGGYEAVIGIGGFLGLGEYTVSLPLGAFSMNDNSQLVLDGYSEEELEAMPEVDESELDGLDDDVVIDTGALGAAMPSPDSAEADMDTDLSAEVEEEMAETGAALEEMGGEAADAAGEVGQDIEEAGDAAATAVANAGDEIADDLNQIGEEIEGEMAEAEAEVTGDTEMAAAADMGQDISDFEGMTVGEVLGMSVEGANGDDVGEIDYIVQASGEYSAVIGIGGFLGLGEYTVELPLDAFSVQGDGTLILDGYTEEELEAMPEVDESELDGLDNDTVIS
ncbi:hypothetical protein KUV65_10735 [Maritalea mobilis]|uniref:hypothetical protein n=1 Tax=Maritalea mobilis TaxID=483324 RepID=UPI001C9432ED|nr:hypothetical protein [Maritalea mobilis]MBY6201840.1 hypothetical protein [Maritalea mobilis]